MPGWNQGTGRDVTRRLNALGERARWGRQAGSLIAAWAIVIVATAGMPLVDPVFASVIAVSDSSREVQAAPAAASCTDRPRVAVTSTRQNGGVSVTATGNTSPEVPNNRLSRLRILAATPNAAIDVRGQTFGANASITFPERPASVNLFIRRTSGTGSVTVPMVFVDDCGEWSTFAGGGAATFGPNVPPGPGSAVGVCGEATASWHPPVVNGCATRHEHGDAPPAWIQAAGHTVSFAGPFNTSAVENTTKHAGMKGFLTTFNGVDVYVRAHAASNVLDRSARYHSYEVFARDPTGGVSHWQGWVNTGDPVTDRVPRIQGDPGRRPMVQVVDQASWNAALRCEQWYFLAAIWSWDLGWLICDSSTLYYPGENNELDRAFWRLPLGGFGIGNTRRLEAAWYNVPGRPHPTGAFWATQLGDLVNGPTDARCSGTTTRFGTTYANVCLPQYIAPTMITVSFPGNVVQRTFPATGVQVPN